MASIWKTKEFVVEQQQKKTKKYATTLRDKNTVLGK